MKFFYVFPSTVFITYYVNLALKFTTSEFLSHDGRGYLNGNFFYISFLYIFLQCFKFLYYWYVGKFMIIHFGCM